MLHVAAPVEDIRGLKPFLAGGANGWAIAFLIIMGIVLAGVLYYLSRRAPADEVEIVEAPTEAPLTLLGRLDALRTHRLNDISEAIRYCDQLSEILRDFLLQRYGLSTRRLTSSELLSELERRQVPEQVCRYLETVFAACDLVKFAKVRLDSTELHQHLTTVYLILELSESSHDSFGSTP